MEYSRRQVNCVKIPVLNVGSRFINSQFNFDIHKPEES